MPRSPAKRSVVSPCGYYNTRGENHCTLLHENCQRKIQLLKLSGENPLSTLVGYENETSRNEDGFNYYAPVFRTVGGTVDANGTRLIDIQEIQLDDSLTMLEANLQILNKGAAKESLYWWIDKTTAGSVGYTDGTRGCWVIEGDLPIPPDPPIMLNPGAAVQIDCPASKTITVLAPIEL